MRHITLSFDNGPTVPHTDTIVDLLDDRGVGASFFVVGEQVGDDGAYASLEHAWRSGHWICNHTYSHGDPLGYSEDAERAAQEIGRAQAAIGALSHPDKFFRPNGAGHMGPHLLSRAAADYLSRNGHTVVTWNNVPEDWTDPREQWVDRALATLAAQPWSLVVIHDFLIGPMLGSLGRFIDLARASGATFVQDFPPDCVHMHRGVARASLAAITMPALP